MSATFHGIDADLAGQLIDAAREEELARQRYYAEYRKWMVVPGRKVEDPLDGAAKEASQIWRAHNDKTRELARRIWPEPVAEPSPTSSEGAPGPDLVGVDVEF